MLVVFQQEHLLDFLSFHMDTIGIIAIIDALTMGYITMATDYMHAGEGVTTMDTVHTGFLEQRAINVVDEYVS